MKKILLLFLLSLTACSNEGNKVNGIMTYDDMMKSSSYRRSIEEAEIELSFEELKEEKSYIVLEKNKCQIVLNVNETDENTYNLGFHFVEYATSDIFVTYSTMGYLKEYDVISPPSDIKVIFQVDGKEIEQVVSWTSRNPSDYPDVNYELKIVDSIFDELGTDKDMKIRIHLDNLSLERAKRD